MNESEAKVLITIRRGACFDTCPIYSAQIYTDGTVNYEGIEYVVVKGKRQHKISEETIRKLIDAFARANYFSLKDEYETDENGTTLTDMPTTITSISINGNQKQVTNYFGAPKKLDDLEDQIDDLAGLNKYLK